MQYESKGDDQDTLNPARTTRIDAIMSGLLDLDQLWAQFILSYPWDETSCLSQAAHAAALGTPHLTHEPPAADADEDSRFCNSSFSVAASNCLGIRHSSHVRRQYSLYIYGVETSGHRSDTSQAISAYTDARSKLEACDVNDFDQAAVDAVLGHAVGCIRQGKKDVQGRIESSLRFAGNNETLDKILEGIEQLTRDCDAWKRQYNIGMEEDNHPPSDATTSQSLLTAALCGAIACDAGMVLPLLWGTAVPWALVLTGACVGSVLGYRAALSQPSVGQMAWMLMGWAAMGLGASVASLGVLSLVVSYGIALAMGIGATALCLGGLGSLWSQGIRIATRGNSERTTSPSTRRENPST